MQAGQGTGGRQAPDVGSEHASTTAVVRFGQSAHGSGVSRTGQVRPGGSLVVVYDPARLPPDPDVPGASWDIMCHVLFQPSGEHHQGSVLDTSASLARAGTPPHVPFAVPVPCDATEVALWFEGRGSAGTSGWDSRYGQNYTFPVLGEGLSVPEPSVAPRAETIIDPEHIHVVEDAAAKEKTAMGRAGRRLRTALVIRALVADTTGATDAWADIHIFDSAGDLIHASSVTLNHRETTDDGALFAWEDDVYQGSGGGSGIGVWSRPDAHTIQYRLYCKAHSPVFETQPQVFTDGVLHEFALPADEDVDDVPRETGSL